MQLIQEYQSNFFIGNTFEYDFALNLLIKTDMLYDVVILINTPEEVFYDVNLQLFYNIDSIVDENSFDILRKGNEKEYLSIIKKSELAENHIDLVVSDFYGNYKGSISKKLNQPFMKMDFAKQISNSQVINAKYYDLFYTFIFKTPQNNILNHNNVLLLLVNAYYKDRFINDGYFNSVVGKEIVYMNTFIKINDIKDVPMLKLKSIQNYIHDFNLYAFFNNQVVFNFYNVINKYVYGIKLNNSGGFDVFII